MVDGKIGLFNMMILYTIQGKLLIAIYIQSKFTRDSHELLINDLYT